jgi:hypothetical protein
MFFLPAPVASEGAAGSREAFSTLSAGEQTAPATFSPGKETREKCPLVYSPN